MWYAVKINGEISGVRFFNEEPTIFDFSIYVSSQNSYEIVTVRITEI